MVEDVHAHYVAVDRNNGKLNIAAAAAAAAAVLLEE